MTKTILKANLEKSSVVQNDNEINDEKLPFITLICLVVIFISAGLVGILPKTILGIIILCACLPLMSTKDIYMVYPVIIFYHLQLGQLFGVSVYSLFSLIFLLITFFKDRDIKINVRFVAPFVLFVVYCFIVLAPHNMSKALLAIFDTFSIMILITQYLEDQAKLKKFFKIFALIALVAFFTGTQIETSFDTGIVVNGEVLEMVRNCATFEDPNYMGFFYTLAIFSVITLKLFNIKFRVLLVIVLYAMLLSTLSMTAILVNSILWVLYLIITKRVNLKTTLVVLLVVAILFALYLYGKKNSDALIFGMLATRITAKFDGIFGLDTLGGMYSVDFDDLGSITSGRTNLAKIHIDYFMELPIWRMFIGMNAASALKTDLDGFRSVAHNEYVDWLLNVGFIGFAIMIWFLLKRLFDVFMEYRRSHSSESLCIMFSKFAWIAYAFTLTLYGDFRFLFALYL